ncbi:hypothetical protein SAICODRAFT_28024 [Saitoella complicata NRRL Y-17804]|uniref:Uncharacterized protein n=1 Tax=Saitoella complicata (strain BCRC 22490 / CBS 7301 / JCM 7358 / NBRC 10748 / NRRL Y-17804) TaxID=698492 RepID=A0A0E9NCX2_SAICN|nr:uncharacterized protein SAICODRAFT_28024 [Saitoella complicata NRRL Y-17804]ODQ49865.1 hypothetical protein SAICODRAFT_28024 [Saitoella complicata NRRL Y-17804]GAO47712.1 hypothetical protein G7K_1911-t1 [Saitoella complicata NRRL Y-17804]
MIAFEMASVYTYFSTDPIISTLQTWIVRIALVLAIATIAPSFLAVVADIFLYLFRLTPKPPIPVISPTRSSFQQNLEKVTEEAFTEEPLPEEKIARMISPVQIEESERAVLSTAREETSGVAMKPVARGSADSGVVFADEEQVDKVMGP